MINTLLFDFDGTLVDSMPTYASSMLRLLDENGIEYNSDIVKTITPLGLIGTADYFINLGLNMSREAVIEQMRKNMAEEYFYRIPAKSNVTAVLRSLKERGLSLNVLTASPHLTLDACLKRLDIYGLFDNVWSSDDFDTVKSDPEIYREAAARLGRSVDEVLFLDDNLNADIAAKRSGMRVCGVYDSSSDEYTEDIKAAADIYIYDFCELEELLLGSEL